MEAKRGEVYSAERIGERGDPCGVPYDMGKGSDMKVPIFRVTVLSMRKESAHWHMLSGKPLI